MHSRQKTIYTVHTYLSSEWEITSKMLSRMGQSLFADKCDKYSTGIWSTTVNLGQRSIQIVNLYLYRIYTFVSHKNKNNNNYYYYYKN
jgi:hypothetical protein